MNLNKIKEKITSGDKDVLVRSNQFLDEKLRLLHDRIQHIESRANGMIALIGIETGFIVFFGEVFEKNGLTSSTIVLSLYFATILLIVRAIYYSMRVLWVQSINEVNGNSVFAYQSMSEVEVLQDEITGKNWEYWGMSDVQMQKLYLFNRCQRNAVVALIAYLLLAITLFVGEEFLVNISVYIESAAIIVVGGVVLFNDYIWEKQGKLWNL